MKTLGLIGGMSWESTAIYYRLLNEGVQRRLGGLHSAKLLLHSVDFAEIAARQAAADWEALTGMMVEAAQRLARGGADALVICTNTMHKCAPAIAQAVPLPIVHIADATAAAIRLSAARRPALLATRYTMQQDFYRGHLRERHGIETLVPDAAGRDRVHGIIYEELCRGMVRPDSKAACLGEVAALRARGADGLILGCTEICMLLSQADFAMPVFDTTAIHAEAALDFALA
ncbi:MAG: aspartate/glutamate racemase family protein [Pseudorhodoplanes sp.]